MYRVILESNGRLAVLSGLVEAMVLAQGWFNYYGSAVTVTDSTGTVLASYISI